MGTIFESAFWSIELPSGWTVTQEEECTTLQADYLMGKLQLSSARKEKGLVTDEDLREFAQDHIEAGAKLGSAEFGPFSGFYISYSTEDTYWREWWLRSGTVIVYVTYRVELDAKGTENVATGEVLSTLKPVQK